LIDQVDGKNEIQMSHNIHKERKNQNLTSNYITKKCLNCLCN
jgi:hypothetical protein